MTATKPEENLDVDPNELPVEEEEEKRVFEKESWMTYIEPSQIRTLITKRWVKFSSYIGIYYMFQLVGCVGVVNFYSDVDRFSTCQQGQTPEESAAVFDNALLLFAIFHLIEWIKTTLLLSVACVGLPLMHVYYISSLNTLFGFVVTIYTLITLMSEEGEACAEVQANRGWWLKTEVIAFIALFFLYPGPVLPLFGCTKESHDEILNKGDDESDSEEED